MKKIKRLFTVIVALGLLVGLSGFALVNEPAVVIHEDGGCNISGINASLHSVANFAGNTTLVCKAKKTSLIPGFYSDFGCNTYLGFTTNSQLVVSNSGNASLRCQVKHE